MPYRPLANGTQLSSSKYERLDDYITDDLSIGSPQLCNALGRVGPTTDSNAVASMPWLTLVLGSEALAPTLRYAPSAVASRVGALFANLAERRHDDNLTAYDTRAVESFILSLCNSRAGAVFVLEPSGAADAADLMYDDWKLRLFHAAATLNATYFFTKAVHGAPVNRWEDEPISLSVLGGPRPRRDGYLSKRWDFAQTAIKALRDAIPKTQPRPRTRIQWRAVENLTNRIHGRIALRQIGADDLTALTEAAWYFLAQELVAKESGGVGVTSEGYLAWPDLLIPLGFPESRDAVRGRPSLTSPHLASKKLQDELMGASEHRARTYFSLNAAAAGAAGDYGDQRLNAYRLYSDILAAEARIHGASGLLRETRPMGAFLGGDDPLPATPSEAASPKTPPATAIVTSFDVELELSLRRHHPDVPILVVLPMTVIDNDRSKERARSSSLWMGYLIEPGEPRNADDLLKQITQPRAANWFCFTNSPKEWGTTNPHVEALRNSAAIVVRLTGSPLVSFPREDPAAPAEANAPIVAIKKEIQRQLKEQDNPQAGLATEDAVNGVGGGNTDGLSADAGDERAYEPPLRSVLPATVLEEHHALQLSFPEILSQGGGLPTEFTSQTPQGFWRYWALLGVQASNEAIRYRLVAQLIGPRLHATSIDLPQRSGVAINSSQLSSRAADLLQWSEFDVVTEATSVEVFSAPLRHYLSHLTRCEEAGSVVRDDQWWHTDADCPLKEGE